MRSFLSGKIYKIVPALLKFKTFFPTIFFLSLTFSVPLISSPNEGSGTPLCLGVWGEVGDGSLPHSKTHSTTHTLINTHTHLSQNTNIPHQTLTTTTTTTHTHIFFSISWSLFVFVRLTCTHLCVWFLFKQIKRITDCVRLSVFSFFHINQVLYFTGAR